MNVYERIKHRHQREIDAFPMGIAFNKKQFAEMLKTLGLTIYDTDKLLPIENGCYIRKADKEEFNRMLSRHKKEIEFYIAHDKTGTGFIYDMFLYELANHEFCVTCDLSDTIEALGLTIEKINKDKRLRLGLRKAKSEYLKHYNTIF